MILARKRNYWLPNLVLGGAIPPAQAFIYSNAT
jgi:hypothetical protein